MGSEGERRPGGYARARGERYFRNGLLAAGGLVVLAVALLVALVFGRANGIYGAVSGLALLGLALRVRTSANTNMPLMERWLKGARGEEVVGALLNELRSEGWIVTHDVPVARGANYDHIASGRNGVFLVETKHRRYRDEDLGRVKRQALALHEQLGVWVTPVLCLATREKEPYRHAKVWVTGASHLLPFLRSQRNATIDPDRLEGLGF